MRENLKPLEEYPSKQMPKEYAHQIIVDKFPNATYFSIPREVMDRLDLTPASKLVYGVIARYPRWVHLRWIELAGLSGMSITSVQRALKLLQSKKLIEKKSSSFTASGRIFQQVLYKATPPPKRNYTKRPTTIRNNIGLIVQDFKEYFHEIDLDS